MDVEIIPQEAKDHFMADQARKSCMESRAKIIDFETWGKVIQPQLLQQVIVLCHGVFDLLHIGHIKHFQQARAMGHILIVTLTADKFVNKGPGRPYFSEQLRAEAIAALSSVDYVIINHSPTAVPAIQKIRPQFYVKGIEYQTTDQDVTGKIVEEEETVKQAGGELKFTQDIVFSSSTLLNRFLPSFSLEVQAYLDQLRQQYTISDLLKYLENAKTLNVLLVGEAIVDIYHFGEAIGKAGKEPVLVTKYHREEMYVGGVLAVANHLASFCSEVTCVTMIGQAGDYEDFIRAHMKPNVKLVLHYKESSPTIVKRRYLEEYTSQKLFEIYEIDDSFLNPTQSQAFLNSIENKIHTHDLTLIADYGHGLLNTTTIEKIQQQSRFLAVNAQSNAGNHGFNCISRYTKADYVCIASRELQLNYRQKHISVTHQLQSLIKDFAYKNIMVTLGREGSFSYQQGGKIFHVPAFATTIKDRIGAGDAVLAVTTLCVAQSAPAEIVGFIGNVVGSEAVNIIGNQSFIEKVPLMKHIMHLMK